MKQRCASPAVSRLGSGAGASKITQDVTNIVAQVPATVEALTGVDIIGGIRNLPTFRKLSGADKPAEGDTKKS